MALVCDGCNYSQCLTSCKFFYDKEAAFNFYVEHSVLLKEFICPKKNKEGIVCGSKCVFDKNRKAFNCHRSVHDKKWRRGTRIRLAATFLMGISGISLMSGFGYAIGTSRKSDPKMFDKGMIKTRNLHSAGSTLAMKALGWGTLYAVGGFTMFCCLIWKLSGAKDMQEFRMKMGKALPNIPKNDPPQGRTEFEGLTDLLQYVIEEDLCIKNQKEQNKMQNQSIEKE